MKMMLFNNTCTSLNSPSTPCRTCILRLKPSSCRKIPAWFCIKYGGFQLSDTKIFTL